MKNVGKINRNIRKMWNRSKNKTGRKSRVLFHDIEKYIKRSLKRKNQIMNAKQKIHLQSAKKRKQKVEKNVDRILIAGCTVVCLTAALMEAGIFKRTV